MQRKLKSFLCWFPWCHLFPKAFFWLKVIKTFLQTFHKTTLFLIDKGHPYTTSFFGILILTYPYVFWPLKFLPLIKMFFCPSYQAWNRTWHMIFPSISYYFHIPKIFLDFFPHTGKNRNRRKSNLLPLYF